MDKMLVGGEWNIDYLYPDAGRYKKSRQEYYYVHEDKIPKPDIKRVWQLNVAKPAYSFDQRINPDKSMD